MLMANCIQNISVRFRDLPFAPEDGADVIFMDGGHDERADRCVRENLDFIRERMTEVSGGRFRFVYLPALYGEIAEAVRYCAPYVERNGLSIGNDALLAFMACRENRSGLGPCFLTYYYHEEDGIALYKGVMFSTDGVTDIRGLLSDLCVRVVRMYGRYTETLAYCSSMEEVDLDLNSGPLCFSCIDDVLSPDGRISDERLRQIEIDRIKSEVQERIEKLRQHGVSEWALRRLIAPERKLSRLVVTGDLRVLLPDYGNMEIKMEPIVMAVFLLFLRHPEGIVFKSLPDYRDELTRIYAAVLSCNGHTRPFTERQLTGIVSVTNPLSNSINEKCARIRAAFLSQFDEYLATDYFVTGHRGDIKRIILPRELVEWQAVL